MPNIANIGHGPRLFRDKAGQVVEIMPGEAKPVDIDKDHPDVVAFARARLIEVGGTKTKAEKAAREKSPVTPPAAEATVTE